MNIKILNWIPRLYKKFKISTRMIFAYSVLIVICILLIASFSFSYSANIIETKESEYIHHILGQTSETVDNNFITLETTINTFIARERIFNILEFGKSEIVTDVYDLNNLSSALAELVFLRKEIASIYIYDYLGKIYKYNLYKYTKVFQLDDLKSIAAEGNGKFVWLDPDATENIISCVKLIKNTQLEDIGVILVNIKKDKIEELYNWEKNASIKESLIINSDGEIIISNKTTTNELLDMNAIKALLLNDDNFLVNEINIENNKYLIYSYTSSYNKWKYVSLINKDELIRESKNLRDRITIIGVFFVILFVLISVIISYSITGPIEKITKSMKEFNIKGNTILVKMNNDDEIKYLYDTFLNMIKKINNLIETKYEMEILFRKQQLEILQSQINPHFLFNTFDIIGWITREKNIPEIGDIIKALSEMMRYSIYCDCFETTVKEEIENIMNYMKIQKIRYEEKLDFSIEVDKRLFDVSLLRMTMQPILENIFIHGFTGIKRKRIIKVQGYFDDGGQAYLAIIDNGIGINKEKIARILGHEGESRGQHSGIGLFNVNKRLKIQFGEEYGIFIESIEGLGTKVLIKLNYNGNRNV